MSKPYVSSIINKYGDTERVKQDAKTLTEILGRQGDKLLMDVIAESIGSCVNKYSLNETERKRLVETTVEYLRDSILERV